VTQEYPSNGAVIVKGRILGRETLVAVDDWFPFLKNDAKTPMLAKASPSGGLWGAFLEKVWAKLNGNYRFIEGGWTAEVMRFISGAPT